MSANQLKTAISGQANDMQAARDALDPYQKLKRQLEVSKGEFMPLLGTQANVDRFIRVVLNSALANPALIDADRRTFVSSCMKAAQDGLIPDGREAALVIYNTKVKRDGREEWISAVQYMPMVAGLIKKLYESGEVLMVDAAAVYARDGFVWRRGDDPHLEHLPTMEAEPGEVVACYCVIKLKNGEIKREVVPRRDIDRARAVSKSNNGPAWTQWFDQMGIKVAIRRASKQMPKADELQKLLEREEREEALPLAAGGIDALAGQQTPALGHSEPDVLEPVVGQPVGEAVPAGQQQELPGAGTDKASTTTAVAAAHVLVNRIKSTKDKDAAALMVDESRSLGGEAYAMVEAAYAQKFDHRG